MKKPFLFIVAACALVACGNKKQQQEPAPEVNALIVATTTNSVPYQMPAQLRGKQDIFVIPQVSALLTQVLVEEGQEVKRGQRMFVLDDTEYRSVYDNALAQLRTAELEESAKKQLLVKDIISDHEYQVAANNLERARAGVRNAENNLSHCVITAPSDGVVGNINYRQGSLVGPQIQTPLTIVSDNHIVYAYISMNEKLYNTFMIEHNGNKEELLACMPPCRLILSNDSIYELPGKVETVSGIIDPNTGAISVRVAFPNPKRILATGGTAIVQMNFDMDGILIPRTATYEIQDKSFAYRIHTDSVSHAVSTIVEPYRLNKDEYIIFAGLNDGDTIIVDGVKKLENNQVVMPKFSPKH